MSAPSVSETTLHGHEALRLSAGDLEAVFLPTVGMLCASLKLGGEQLLGRTDEIEKYLDGSTIAIPLLHPWANRVESFLYEAVNRSVLLERNSPLLHYDANGLPIHGVPGARLDWDEIEEEADGRTAAISARLAWMPRELLEIFPYPHWLDMDADLDAGGLTITTTLTPRGDIAVPIAFGYHPYFRIPGVPRADWRLELPPMRRLELDDRMIPTSVEQLFSWKDEPLGNMDLDHAFRLLQPRPRFTLRGGDRHLTIAFLEGYTYAQIYAPADRDFIAIEPMTAPGNALVSNHGLRAVPPGSTFRATFRVEL